MTTCPSTFEHGTHICQLPDRDHQDLHWGAPGVRWSDLQADENQKKAA